LPEIHSSRAEHVTRRGGAAPALSRRGQPAACRRSRDRKGPDPDDEAQRL